MTAALVELVAGLHRRFGCGLALALEVSAPGRAVAALSIWAIGQTAAAGQAGGSFLGHGWLRSWG